MPCTTSWLDAEKTIIIHHITGRWTIDEVLTDLHLSAKRLDAETYKPKYFIVDLTQANGIPNGLLVQKSRFDNVVNPESVTVIVGAHRVVQVLVTAMQKLGISGIISFAETIESALEFIEDYRKNDSD